MTTLRRWRSALYAKPQINTQNFQRIRLKTFLLIVRKHIKCPLRLHGIICIFKYPIFIKNPAIRIIPEKYILSIHYIISYFFLHPVLSLLRNYFNTKQSKKHVNTKHLKIVFESKTQ